MKVNNKILLSISAVLLLYGAFYIFNSNTPPTIKTVEAKYLPTESLKDLELEAELIVKAMKVSEENKILVTESSSDSNITYEDPLTLSAFKIEKVYVDETNSVKASDELVVEEFAGYTKNLLTGKKTLVIPGEYTLATRDHSYLLFLRKSKSSPDNYIIFANHFGKFTLDSTENSQILSKFNQEESLIYQEIEHEAFQKYQ